MYNFFVEENARMGDSFRIDGKDYNHICNVLRMQIGATFLVSCGGTSNLCRLERVEDEAVVAEPMKCFINPNYAKFIEPKIIVVTDPRSDAQAILESKQNGIPVVGLCDSENLLANVEICVPSNNKGRKAIALIYWLLARQLLRERGVIGEDEDLDLEPSDFELKF